MIKYNPKNWFKLIFAFHRSDTLRMLWKELLYMVIFTLIVAYLEITYFPEATYLKELISVFSLVGFVISLLLVFRTNTAYDRWWEGRKKWGCLVNDTRNLSIKLSSLVENEEDRAFFKRMIPNFVFATKEHLREGVLPEELDLNNNELSILENKHVPNAVFKKLYERITALKSSKKISEMDFLVLDKNLNALIDSLGACERIKNTPMPFSYNIFLKKFIFMYVSALPLAFVTTFGYFSALIATFVFYIFVSMEVLAEEIEDPFGRDDNDLPTDILSDKIKENVAEIFG